MAHKPTLLESRLPLLEVKASLSPRNPIKNAVDDGVFTGAKDIIASWFQNMFDFDSSVLGEQNIRADDRHIEITASENLWACRAVYPDPKDHTRIWITEVMLEKNGKPLSPIQFALSQSTQQAKKDKKTPPPLYPDFVGRLAAEYAMKDGSYPLTSHVTMIREQRDALKLIKFLKNEQHNRTQPVVVFTEPEINPGDCESALAVAEQEKAKNVATTIARHAAGAVHVIWLSSGFDGLLMEGLGQKSLTKPGDTRIYPAHTPPDRAFSYKTIAEDHARKGWIGFIQYLNARLGKVSCKNNDIPSPFFAQAQSKIQNVLPEPNHDEDIEETLNKLVKIAGKLTKIEAAKVQEADQDSEELSKELKGYIAQLQDMKAADRQGELAAEFGENIDKAKMLRRHFVAASYGITKPYEEKYEALSNWVDEHYKNRIVLANAVKSAFKNPQVKKYRDVNLVYAVIELMATHYYQMKTTEGSALRYHQRMFEERLRALHVDETRTFSSDITRQQYKAAYTVSVDSEEYFLDRHVKRGTSQSPEDHLRVYYAWDEKRKRVIVGHATSHKQNSLTT